MNGLWNYWNSLSQGVRDAIVGGIISTLGAAAILSALKLSGISILALFRRLFSPQLAPAPTPQIIVNVPPPTLPSPTVSVETPEPISLTPLIPKSPAVGFVARRDKEGRDILGLLKEALAPGTNQLIALWGEGGIGKTTLAAEAARALSADYEQRVVWTSADKRADYTFSTFLDEIASRLNRADILRLAIAPKASEVQLLIASDPTLIVLDNFETIPIDEQRLCAEFLENQSPHPALITTRVMVDGARNILIDAMSAAEAEEFLARLIKQSPEPNIFAGLQAEKIIQTAVANPLAMEWILAQINLAQKPSDVLDDLAEGEGDAAQRVFDRSFNLPQLGDDGRAALLALSLFVPSASRTMLREVAGFGTDQKRLNEAVKGLAALRLVGTTVAGERLMIQGLTRELAKSHLNKDGRAGEFRRRFIAHFLSYAKSNSEATAEDLDALEVERDNLLSAMDLAFRLEDWHSGQEFAYVLAEPVTGMLSMHGYWDDAIRTNEQALKAARNQVSQNEVAAFAHNLAVMHGNRGELIEAQRLYDESLEIKKKLGNQSGIANTLHQLAMLAHKQGELNEAQRLYNESLEIQKKLNHQRGVAATLHGLAMLAQEQGALDEARRLYTESLEIEKELGNERGIGVSLHELARLAQNQGQLDEARRLYHQSFEIAKKLGDQSGIAISLGQLGILAEDEGNNAEAVRLFGEALAIFEKLKSSYAEIARQDLARVQGKGKSLKKDKKSSK